MSELKTKSIEFFLKSLNKQNIKLWIDNDNLRYHAPAGALNNDLLQQIKDNKSKIIEHLKIKESKKIFYEPIIPVENNELYNLSSAQKRIFFINQLDTESTAYNLVQVIKIDGRFDIKKLEDILKTIINRHEILRTSFEYENNEPVQIVHDNIDLKLEYDQIDNNKKTLDNAIDDFIKPFDLSKPPLFRVKCIKIKTGKPEYYIIYDMHHIISDGISIGLLVNEVNDLYAGKSVQDIKIQYRDYAAWQQKLLSSEELERQKNFWNKKFEKIPEPLNLLTDYPRPAVQSYKGNVVSFTVEQQLSSGLLNLAKNNNTTLYSVLLTAYYILISKYTNQQDIIIGTPTAGRRHADLYNTLGIFVNTIALRNNCSRDLTFTEFLKQVSKNVIEAFENQEYQFEQLINDLNIERSRSRNPLFDTMFILQNMRIDQVHMGDAKASYYDYRRKSSQFDLTLAAVQKNNCIDFSFEYCTDLYKQETISNMIIHFKKILDTIIEKPGMQIDLIEIITENEKNEILNNFNSKINYNIKSSVVDLFEKTVLENMESKAVICSEHSITYKELNEKSNQLARIILKKGIEKENIIGIMCPRSIEMIIAILAVLKTGCAYLPIDTSYPAERINYILENSNSKLLLDISSVKKEIAFKGKTIHIDDENNFNEDNSNLNIKIAPGNLCYVIYTSGSTGKPKGVLLEHKGLVNLVQTQCKAFQISKGTNLLQFASFGFDASVSEIFTALLSGSALYLFTAESNEIYNVLKSNSINVVTLPPSILRIINPEGLDRLKTIVSAGEACDNAIIKKWSKNRKFINAYGPTEATVCTAIAENPLYDEIIHIGKPIDNVKVLILDHKNRLLPAGVPGELCIGGTGLARGYLNNRQLTDEKFIKNPLNSDELLYRSGDLARWLANGNIEFLGRIDHQVKIRGFRIELSEIEAVLTSHFLVEEACVNAVKTSDNDLILYAYYVSQGALDKSVLIKYLKTSLPDYMIPSQFIYLEKMPLNTSGKIDRKTLPVPDMLAISKAEYVPPENDMQQNLSKIWQEALNIQQIGINDNFYDLGGHSIKAIQIVNIIENRLDIKIPLNEFLDNPTVKLLSEKIDSVKDIENIKIERTEDKEYHEVILGIKASIVMQMTNIDNNRDTSSVGTKLYNLDKNIFEKTIKIIVERHDILRSTFSLVDNKAIQKVTPADEFIPDIKYLDFTDHDIDYTIEELFGLTKIIKYDIINGPIFACRAAKLDENKYFINFNIDHLFFDQWSANTIQREFSLIYNSLLQGKENPLKEKPYQYQDYINWIKKRLEIKGDEIKQYWKNVFKEPVPKENFSYYTSHDPEIKKRTLSYKTDLIKDLEKFAGRKLTDFEKENLPGEIKFPNQKRNCLDYFIKLFQEDYNHLMTFCRKNSFTYMPVVVTAFNLAIYSMTGQNDNIFSYIVMDRTNQELNEIIGCMIKTIMLRNKINDNLKIHEYIHMVYKNYKDAYKYRHYQSEKMLNDLDLSANIASIEFNFLEPINKSLDNEEKHDIFKTNKNGPWHDMSVTVQKYENCIVFEFKFLEQTYTKNTIKHFAEIFNLTMLKIINKPEMIINDFIKEMQNLKKL